MYIYSNVLDNLPDKMEPKPLSKKYFCGFWVTIFGQNQLSYRPNWLERLRAHFQWSKQAGGPDTIA